MNRLFLTTSFASISFLPIALQTPSAPSAPEPVRSTVVLTPQAPTAPVAATPPTASTAIIAPTTSATPIAASSAPQASAPVEVVLSKLQWASALEPQEEVIVELQPVIDETQPVIVEVLPVTDETGAIKLKMQTSAPQPEDTEAMRRRIAELEAQVEALSKAQAGENRERVLTVREHLQEGQSGPRKLRERLAQTPRQRIGIRTIHEEPSSAHTVAKHEGNVFRVHSEDHGDHAIEVHAEGEPGEGQGRLFKLRSDGEMRTFHGGQIFVHEDERPGEDHGGGIWVVEDNDSFFSCDEDEGECDCDCDDEDCDECEDCEDSANRIFHFMGGGEHEGFDFDMEEYDLDMEEYQHDMAQYELDMAQHELDMEEFHRDMEMMQSELAELDFDMEDIDMEDFEIDIQEMLEGHGHDGQRFVVKVGTAGPHGHGAAPQPRTVRKRIVRGTAPHAIRTTITDSTPPQAARAPRAPLPPRPGSQRPLPTVASLFPGYSEHEAHAEHDPHGEFSEIIKGMQQEMRELGEVIRDLSRELKAMAPAQGKNKRRKSMR